MYDNIRINKIFKDIKDIDKRFIILYGGAGSGKSHYMSQHVILNCLNKYNVKWCVVRKVARTIKESVFAELTARIREYNLSDFFTINKTDFSIICDVTGSKIIFIGIDDHEKIKSISNITKFWIEEASELTPDDFRQLNLRLRGESEEHKQMYVTFNPVHSRHWLKEQFFDFPKDNAYVLKTTYLNNSFIDDAAEQELEALKDVDQYWYDVYCLGEWGNLTGVIYTNWNVIDIFPEEPDEVIYGLDFGYNNPTALIKIGIKDNEFYLHEELLQSGLTNTDLIALLKTMNLKGRIYADCAEPARIQELRDNGFLSVREADKNVKSGIDFIKAQKLHVTENSINLINELNTYSWQKDKSNNTKDEPVKLNDHLCDAMRYAIYTSYKSHVEVPRISMTSIDYTKEPQRINSPVAAAINGLRTRNRFNRML